MYRYTSGIYVGEMTSFVSFIKEFYHHHHHPSTAIEILDAASFQWILSSHCCFQFLENESCVPGDCVRICMGPGSCGWLGEPPWKDTWCYLILCTVAVTREDCSLTFHSGCYWRQLTIDLFFCLMMFPLDVLKQMRSLVYVPSRGSCSSFFIVFSHQNCLVWLNRTLVRIPR